jgi:type II restriction enzyme
VGSAAATRRALRASGTKVFAKGRAQPGGIRCSSASRLGLAHHGYYKTGLGAFGEERVVRDCSCPRCKRVRTLVRLPSNFKCADVICDFCGYLGQVKSVTTKDIETVPTRILGAAWRPQKERMEAGIYFPLFLVLVNESRRHSIFYLSADVQQPAMFRARTPLSDRAKRAGWQGFEYDLSKCKDRVVRLR